MSYTGTMTPEQAFGEGGKQSCPCPALPEGMVVVRREDIRSMLDYREEEFVEARVRLRVALEKKP